MGIESARIRADNGYRLIFLTCRDTTTAKYTFVVIANDVRSRGIQWIIHHLTLELMRVTAVFFGQVLKLATAASNA